MRKINLFDWGEEILFANEEWFVGKILELQGEVSKTASSDCVLYVLQGVMRVIFGESTYEFAKGKTLFIKEGTNYVLSNPHDSPAEVLEIIRQDKSVKENFSEGSKF
ncbi:hypothetical protein COT72_04665 [archaeon CG10_big_fil_rev_8_21_14_0_10_43_11]|nr:MAG: hypothetical protein COT72_04665 [archaeon CG10_big_fil_rev_8_21_14_0_10_43_11]